MKTANGNFLETMGAVQTYWGIAPITIFKLFKYEAESSWLFISNNYLKEPNGQPQNEKKQKKKNQTKKLC